jgi:hypothetical protein
LWHRSSHDGVRQVPALSGTCLRHAGQVQQQAGNDAGAVLAGHAMEQHRAILLCGDALQYLPGLRLAVAQPLHIDLAE